MSSKVDIVNQGLLLLGARPIISLDDETTEASTAKILYEPAKRQVLRDYPWRCATKVATLARLTETPVDPHWNYAFQWPDDCLRILTIIEMDYPNNPDPTWVVENRKVYTYKDNIAARYIYNINEPDMDATFEKALALKIALDMCYALTASNTREGQLAQLYAANIEEARIVDRQEGSHKTFSIDQLTKVR
jgi:hypothetical protein